MNELIKGSTLQHGKYKIVKTLGQGGFGITYLATQTIIGKKVAIKEFFFKEYCERSDSSDDVTVPTVSQRELVSRFEQKFLKEAKIILNLNHPNIIRVLDVFQENNTSYYAMEYIIGNSLSERISDIGHLSESEALSITESVGKALSYLHQKHINHLDVKPSNIMLDSHENRVVLIDFGVSKQYDPESGDGTTTTPVGISHGYSPIEQYNAGGVGTFSPQSDIYALGATLLKMLTGTTPPSAVDLSQKKIEIPTTVSPSIAKGIKAAMQPIKQDRPYSVELFIKMLRSNSADEETVIYQRDTDKRKKLNGKVVVVTAILLICILGGIYLFNNHEGAVPTSDSLIVAPEDTISTGDVTIQDMNVMTKRFTKETPSAYQENNKIDYEYPTSGNAILLHNVREWINEELGGTYEGDLDDADAMFKYYSTNLGIGQDEEMQSTISIKKVYENETIVTFQSEAYFYDGGAHGSGSEMGTTFRKSDGKIFTKDMVQKLYELQPYIKRGLKKYFGVVSDEELMGYLQIDATHYNVNSLPIPEANPWITEKEVLFRYRSYEISSGAAGEPFFSVPISEIKSFLSTTGKTYFE